MKKSGKFLGVLLAVCMVITMNAVSAYADSGVQDTKWDDYAATEFAGGTGTKDDPYRIENGEQLAKLAKDVSAGNTHKGEYFRLEQDIDLSAHRWIPIGDYGGISGISFISFEGFLDGNCKTISGMVVDQSKDKQSAGLFGYILNTTAGNEVGVKNLTIANAALYVDESIMVGKQFVSAGILVAGAMANPGYKGTIVFENISVSGTITVKATDGINKIGGLIGEDNRGIVRNCATDVTITGASNTGGMTGISSNTTFENCTAKGRISGLWALGGFVGYASSSTLDDKTTESTFTNCIADVAVEASDWNVGGFVGFADFGMFKNSASFGTVTSSVTGWESRVGGFIGCAGKENSNVNFVRCHSASLVTYDEENIYGGWGGFAGKLVAGTTDGCSFIEQPKLNGIGINTTGQQVEECTTQKNLSKICEDVYGGHNYAAELTVDQEATCSEEGSKSHHCIRCDAKGASVVIPKKEHSYSTEWSTDEASHWHECTGCGAKTDEAEHTDTDKNHKCDVCEKVLSECADTNKDHKCDLCGKTLSEHTGGTATCAEKAVCEVCGKSYGELDPKNHTNLKHFPAKAATKTAEGNIEYWYCADCGKYYKDAKATQEITKEQTVTAKLPGGTVKPGAEKSPQTGDNSNLLLWITLLFVSGGAVTVTTVCGRKKKRSVK